ncbi:Glucose-1-phosphate adenylyltransferase large subunit 4, chloroplastic/amyloplastic [Linum perenne]
MVVAELQRCMIYSGSETSNNINSSTFIGRKVGLRSHYRISIHGSQLRNKLSHHSNGRRFLKVSVVATDVTKELKAPIVEQPQADPKLVASIILGGGAGTRLFPLTRTRAKPAVPIGGCYRLIDVPMSNCINSGINKIYILTQFNSQSLNRHIARTYNSANGVNFGDGFVEVLAATQTPGEYGKRWFQGTADAVRQFIWLFELRHIENILILSGDHIYRMDYMDFVQKHLDTGADISVSCIPVDESRASDFGLIKINERGRINQFLEKPKGDALKSMTVDTSILGLSAEEAKEFPHIASMGVYVFNKIKNKNSRLQYPTANDFGSEILPMSLKHYNVQAYLFEGYWEDIGTIRSFFDANLALTEQQNPNFQFSDPLKPIFTCPLFLPPTKIEKCQVKKSIISHGCFLNECSVERCVVGIRSRLEYGVELKDTVMMGADYYQTEAEIVAELAEGKVPIGVGKDTKIRQCIIDKNARIGSNVVIVNKDKVEEAERASEGFYIKSGITIVMKNCVIKDGTII